MKTKVYRSYGITYDGVGSWKLGNDFARNILIFGVANSSPSHTDNCQSNFLVLSEGWTSSINGSFDSLGKKFSINFSKANSKFCLSLHYNGDNNYMLVNGKEIFKLKADNRNINFPAQFCLGSISNGFGATESREVCLIGDVYDFSVDYNAIDKSDILNIYKYLTLKNNIK